MTRQKIFVYGLAALLLSWAINAQVNKNDTRQGHTEQVTAIAFSLDGKLLVSGSEDRTIRLWDVKTGRELKVLGPFSGQVNSLALSPDGKTLVAADETDGLSFWEFPSFNPKEMLKETSNERTFGVTEIVFSPTGKLLAGEILEDVKVWNIENGQTLKSPEGARAPLAFSRNGKLLAARLGDDQILLWDVESGEKVRIIQSGGEIKSLCFSPNNRLLASSVEDEIKLWDVSTGKQLRSIKVDESSCVAFSPDGKALAVGLDQGIKFFDPATGEEIVARSAQTDNDDDEKKKPSAKRGIVFSADGKLLASLSERWPVTSITIWNTATLGITRTLAGHSIAVRTLSFSPDGKLLLSGTEDSTLILWETATGQLQRVLKHPVGDDFGLGVGLVGFSPDGKSFFSCSTLQFRFWETATGRELRALKDIEPGVTCALSRDGKLLATVADLDVVKLWDTTNSNLVRNFILSSGEQPPVTYLYKIAISPDGKVLAAVKKDSLRLWGVESGKIIRTQRGGYSSEIELAFSPDSKLLSVIDRDKDSSFRINLWSVATGEKLQSFQAHGPKLVFSADSRFLIVQADMDTEAINEAAKRGESPQTLPLYRLKLLDVATGKELGFIGIEDSPNTLALTADGKTLAIGSRKGVQLVDIKSGKAIRAVALRQDGVDSALAFSPRAVAVNQFLIPNR